MAPCVNRLLGIPDAEESTSFSLIAAATFFPLLEGQKPDAQNTGPFTAAAEMLNGRAAYALPRPRPPRFLVYGHLHRCC